MSIKPLLKEAAASAEDSAKAMMKAVGITKYRQTVKGVPGQEMLTHMEPYDTVVLLAKKVIRIDDELTRQGFRSVLYKGDWIYVNQKTNGRAWVRVDSNNMLTFTIYTRDAEGDTVL